MGTQQRLYMAHLQEVTMPLFELIDIGGVFRVFEENEYVTFHTEMDLDETTFMLTEQEARELLLALKQWDSRRKDY